MVDFLSSCVALFGSTLSAIMTVDVFAFFVAVLLMAAAVGLTLLFVSAAKK